MPRKLNCAASVLASLMLLSGCATAPNVCPSLPAPPAKVPLGPSFQDQMQHFLAGSLPEPTTSEQPSQPAKTVKETR